MGEAGGLGQSVEIRLFQPGKPRGLAGDLGRVRVADSVKDLGEIDLTDRWVLVFRGLPHALEGPRRQALQRYASLRHKTMVARDRGARGILFVSGPLARYRDELVPLRFDASRAGTRPRPTRSPSGSTR